MEEAKVVFISGAAKRIGACIAETFHAQGFNVALHYNQSKEEAEQLAASLNKQRKNSVLIFQADLNSNDQLHSLAEDVLGAFNRLDVQVNNASSFYPTPLETINQQQWDELINSNLKSALFLTQEFSSELTERGGNIVNVVDTHATTGLGGFSIYSIAKAGLCNMTKSLARELAPNVRVNAVAPGAILWPTHLEDGDNADVVSKRAQALQKIPLGHLGEPQNIADAVLFLATQASYMTGQIINVDGGRRLA